jgi:hypothetical protein
MRHTRTATVALTVICLFISITTPLYSEETIFTPLKIDGPIHDPANHTYWFGPFCECASILDVDGDGDLDISCGRNWYENPHWTKHVHFRDGAETNGPETDDNSEFAMDVNFDGKPDVVSSGWMFMKGAFWYENPGDKEAVWTSTRVHQALNMEGVIHGDIDGDGDDDILCNHWSLVKGQGMTWLEHIDRAPWFVERTIGTEGDVHGNGLGDINMDGRMDIVTPNGWYEQPTNVRASSWPFHADYKFTPAKHRGGGASHPILVHDVDEDGLNDILIGSSHAYGLAWLQQRQALGGKRTFKTHWVETEYSQVHTLALGDLNGDGKADLVTGKRLFAHHGSDIGAGEPLYAFWYDIQKGNFERHILSFNHLPHYPGEMINPAPNYVVSVGMKLNIADINADGRNDVIIAGKGGLYVFFNQGTPTTPGVREKLPHPDSYPSWRDWPKYKVLFNGKDLTGWKIPKGDNGHWKVINGVIDYDAQSEATGGKNLVTETSYSDYSLHIEWRFKHTTGLYPMPTILPDGSEKTDANGKVIKTPTPNADSGIFLRGTGASQVNLWCWPIGSGEMWSVRRNQSLTPAQRAAAVPKVCADNPVGQWNSMDITVVGDRVTTRLNGQVVIDDAQVPGLPVSGPIALQHHGGKNKKTGKFSPASSLIQFKNIWIRPLEKAKARTSSGFITLFSGQEQALDKHWIKGPGNDFAWVVKDGELTVDRTMDGKEHNLDYIWTKEQYDNFVLELEYKTDQRTNSGIFIRTPNLNDPVYTGMEIQVCNSFGRDGLSRGGTAGAVYDCMAPTINTVRAPGEWNQCRVTCQDNLIRIVLNGKEIIAMDVDKWPEKGNMNWNEVRNKFATPIPKFARKGHIGLQDHGRPVWYRNIRIKPLD